MDELNFRYKVITNLREVQDQNKNEETYQGKHNTMHKKALIGCIWNMYHISKKKIGSVNKNSKKLWT